jgi:hypothetical protein
MGAPQITVEQSGKNYIFFGSAAGAPGNHSYYFIIQRLVKLMYSVCMLIYVSMYLDSYPSTHGKSGLAAGGA